MQGGSQQDALAIAQNGGLSGQEAEDGDLDETEVDMDDDMMDKISSSPSIEDGGSTLTLPHYGLRGAEGLSLQLASRCSPEASPVVSDARSSSPYLDYPEHLPPPGVTQKNDHKPRRHHHQYGESRGQASNESLEETQADTVATKPESAKLIGRRDEEDGLAPSITPKSPEHGDTR